MRRAAFCLLMILVGLGAQAAPTWFEDWSAAQAMAKKTGLPLVAVVTGLDWVLPAQRLEDEVFALPEFEPVASRYVLFRADFPHDRNPAEKLRVQNNDWVKTYPVDSLPTVFVIGPDGLVLGRQTGFVEGGVPAWSALLQGFVDRRPTLEALRKAVAQAAPGASRAKAEDALFRQAEAWDLVAPYGDLPLKIVQDDKDGQAGLKQRYQTLGAWNRFLDQWAAKNDPLAAVADLDKLLVQAAPWADLKQKILFTKGLVLWNAVRDEGQAAAALRQARDLDPTSTYGRRATDLLDQLP